jgi:uncharacterized protein with PhoU and TrkA domain
MLCPYSINNCINAIAFIIVNQLHNTITNAALRITALIIPNADPKKYIGIKIFVAGSKIVNVNIALAVINSEASTISHQNAIGENV